MLGIARDGAMLSKQVLIAAVLHNQMPYSVVGIRLFIFPNEQTLS